MKRKRLYLIASLAGLFALSSCAISIMPVTTDSKTTTSITTHEDDDGTFSVPIPSSKGSYKVTFVINNGYTYSSVTNANEYVIKPEDPEKYQSTFTGWYTDKDCTLSFNFNREVSADTILYAGWDTDYLSIFNEISTEYILANVRIEIENYDLAGFGRKTNATSVLGSGVIFLEYGSYYYALTNNHVVYTTTSYQNLTVEDAYENETSFEILGHLNTYDLALIRFKKTTELKAISLADYTLEEGDTVFAMGEPGGLSNTVSYGKILGMRAFEPNEDEEVMSNITFDVYRTSAKISSGSSGGALIDSNMKLLGINFASAVDSKTDDFKYAYAIPAPKVREFVDMYLKDIEY